MMTIKRTFSVLLLSITLLWIKCITNVAGGIGHEGEAKIFGRVVYANSDSLPTGASVFINSDDYIHFFTKSQNKRTPDAFVNDSGYFFLDHYPKGSYTIEINDGKSNGVLINCEIKAGDTAVILSVDTLRTTGVIFGKIIDTTNTVSQMSINLKGLERVALIKAESDSFVFYDIPSGSYELVASMDNVPSIKIGTLELNSADTLFVNYKYVPGDDVKSVSKTIFLNTLDSDADISEDVCHFPLLIALNQDNFNFSDTEVDGKDIYFTKTNGEYLPFEIEYWNSDQMSAFIWVLMDTIYANCTSQSILIHWSKQVTSPAKDSKTVFDTSFGFQGVWHFSELQADTIADATANNFYGIPKSLLTDVSGQIGYAKSFNGTSDFITMPTTDSSILNFPENGSYTLSAWIFIKSSDTLFHSIITKGNRMYGLQINDSAQLEIYEYSTITSWNVTTAAIDAGHWHYCVGVRNREKQYLYIDGVCVDSTITTLGNLRNRITDESLCIGNRVTSSEDGYFNGYIDEVRIHNKALDSDWIRLAFINQSGLNGLINIK